MASEQLSDAMTADKVRALMATPAPFDQLYGLEIVLCTPDRVEGRLEIGPSILQPFGMVHGGVYSAMAEGLASHATNLAVADAGSIALGLSNFTSLMRPASSGVLHVVASPCHKGRTTWIWDVEVRDDAGRLCATSRTTLAVRPFPAP